MVVVIWWLATWSTTMYIISEEWGGGVGDSNVSFVWWFSGVLTPYVVCRKWGA
jgi:hypothetical protein